MVDICSKQKTEAMSLINFNFRKGGLLFLLMFFGGLVNAQMSYEEFHERYKPHYETIAPNFETATIINDMDDETAALGVELLMDQYENENHEDAQIKVVAILTSCKRSKVAGFLKAMDTETAVRALNYLKFDWQIELMHFVDRETYQNIAPNLLSMLLYDGPKGPFGPERDNWSPVYAGAGFDFAWSGMAGFNNVIDGYGTNEETNRMTGFGAFAGFKTSDMNFVEIHYQNRSAGVKYENPAFSDVKFGQHTIGVNFLKGKAGNENNLFVFNRGWGIHANIASWSVNDATTGKTKVGSGINGGLSYNAQLFINPFKKVPVVFGLRGYAQINFPRHDFNTLNDNLFGLAEGTSMNDDNASVISSFGGQVQVMYKFGKAEDDREFIDFDTELANTYDKRINTSYTEILPIVSPDGRTLYFIRSDHPYNTKGSYASQDIWVADISNGLDGEATRLTDPFNQNKYNMIAGVSPDGNAMVIKGIYGADASKIDRGYSIIYKTKTGWTTPKTLDVKGYDDMSKGLYTGAYWTQDGKHLILSMSEETNGEHQDLYVSHLQDDGSYSGPIPLGPTINGDDTDDHSPFMASDGKTLYFSSNRDGSLGSNDIWMTKREDDSWTKWSEPVNLGSEVNTESWDAYYSIDAQGKYAYMASSENSVGNEDIVRIELHEEVQPDPVVLVKGKVLNKKTGEPLDATLSYNGLTDGKNYGVARTNPATGEYTIVLPYGVNYEFTALAKDYIGISDNLDLTEVGEYKEIEMDLYLVPIEVGATVRLNNIFFETGKDELKAESYSELNRVVKFLNDNPTVKIELSGHTDNVGDKGMNKTLSQKRADAVLAYLTSKGIAADRLVAKGYGMEKPVADNATEQGKAQNRRVEFTILEN